MGNVKYKFIKLLVILVLSSIFYYLLYSSSTYGLKDIPAIEIKNECKKDNNNNGGKCERKFDVPTYFEDIKNKLDNTLDSHTLIEKLAGINPDIFKYSIGFEDKSFIKQWKGQHSEMIQNPPRGKCPFKNIGIKETKEGAVYEKQFGLSMIPEKLKELATSLNDCQQYVLFYSSDIENIERTEKYIIFIKLGFWNLVSIGFLALSLTVLVLSVVKSLYKFIVRGLGE